MSAARQLFSEHPWKASVGRKQREWRPRSNRDEWLERQYEALGTRAWLAHVALQRRPHDRHFVRIPRRHHPINRAAPAGAACRMGVAIEHVRGVKSPADE